ncbi:MAG: SLC13 family permease [Bacillota bacterium]|jgi:Na+/H+ antiporter NhaD/arsenite permease-like protein
MNLIVNLLHKEPVMMTAGVLALLSVCLVAPSASYLSYIDYGTLALLFSLMTVVAGLEKIGFFGGMAENLLKQTKTVRGLMLVLVLLCFFGSMFFTNDVVLIMFVPFSIKVLAMVGREEKIILTVVLQTVAANMGSMLLPIGNPQNLYLYQYFDLDFENFIGIIAPYAAVAFVLLLGCIFLCKPQTVEIRDVQSGQKLKTRFGLWLYGALFLLSILAVLRVLPAVWLIPAVLVPILLYDPGVLKKVDYSLLLTFVFFFIFVGNLKAVPQISEWLQTLLTGREMIATLAASQVISNVPATVLFSGFTGDYADLLIGASLGGLGTLVASLASLISFKIFAGSTTLSKSRYLLVFTVCNVGFLLVLGLVYGVFGS